MDEDKEFVNNLKSLAVEGDSLTKALLLKSGASDEGINFLLKSNTVFSCFEIPIFYGFVRQCVAVFSRNPSTDDVCLSERVTYSIEGHILSSPQDVHKYLVANKIHLPISFFTFEPAFTFSRMDLRIWNRPENIYKQDVADGKERLPIPAICTPQRKSLAEGNHMCKYITDPLIFDKTVKATYDHDKGFLICCLCENDCQDKLNCPCFQKTLDNCDEKLRKEIGDINIGYNCQRLQKNLLSGIFECNSQCRCSKLTCFNRVSQNGIFVKMQFFFSIKKGWCVRTLHDIPAGSFVCTYVGEVIGRRAANRKSRKVDGSDWKYMAELYLGDPSKDKEGYEEDVIEPELGCQASELSLLPSPNSVVPVGQSSLTPSGPEPPLSHADCSYLTDPEIPSPSEEIEESGDINVWSESTSHAEVDQNIPLVLDNMDTEIQVEKFLHKHFDEVFDSSIDTEQMAHEKINIPELSKITGDAQEHKNDDEPIASLESDLEPRKFPLKPRNLYSFPPISIGASENFPLTVPGLKLMGKLNQRFRKRKSCNSVINPDTFCAKANVTHKFCFKEDYQRFFAPGRETDLSPEADFAKEINDWTKKYDKSVNRLAKNTRYISHQDAANAVKSVVVENIDKSTTTNTSGSIINCDFAESRLSEEFHSHDTDYDAETIAAASPPPLICLDASKETNILNESSANSPPPSSKVSSRRKRSSKNQSHPMLDFCYTVDGHNFGNIGRYLNHSCNPNLFAQSVFWDCHDLRLPRIAFFSARNIRAGEELTWDYKYENDGYDEDANGQEQTNYSDDCDLTTTAADPADEDKSGDDDDSQPETNNEGTVDSSRETSYVLRRIKTLSQTGQRRSKRSMGRKLPGKKLKKEKTSNIIPCYCDEDNCRGCLVNL